MEDHLKILFLAANPIDAKYRPRLDREYKEISHKILTGHHRNSIRLVCEWSVRVSDVAEALLNHKPEIVHFGGHGTKSNGIVLEDDLGNARPVDKKALARLFSALRDNIRVVVLNACYADDQASYLREIVDYTIGMSDQIADRAAITFASYFYQALSFGRTVPTAFEVGLAQLALENPDASHIPRLLVRDGKLESESLLPVRKERGAPERRTSHSSEDARATGGSTDSPVSQTINVSGRSNIALTSGRILKIGSFGTVASDTVKPETASELRPQAVNETAPEEQIGSDES